MVESISVISNGDVPGSTLKPSPGKQNNAISASLIYPRGGYAEISGVVQADLESNVPYQFDTANFFGPDGDGVKAPGLFKGEEIEDFAPLKIQVTTREDAGQLAGFISKVFCSLLNSAVKLVPGGQIVAAVLGAVTGGVGDLITTESKKSDGSPSGPVEVIGTAKVSLDAASLLGGPNPLRMVLPLIAPNTITKSWFETQTPPGGGPPQNVQVSGNLTTKGQPNGMIHLLIHVSPA